DAPRPPRGGCRGASRRESGRSPSSSRAPHGPADRRLRGGGHAGVCAAERDRVERHGAPPLSCGRSPSAGCLTAPPGRGGGGGVGGGSGVHILDSSPRVSHV